MVVSKIDNDEISKRRSNSVVEALNIGKSKHRPKHNSLKSTCNSLKKTQTKSPCVLATPERSTSNPGPKPCDWKHPAFAVFKK